RPGGIDGGLRLKAAYGPGWWDDPTHGPARGPPGPSAKPARYSRASIETWPQSSGSTRTGHGRHRERHAHGADDGHSERSPAPDVSVQTPNRRRAHRSVPTRDAPAEVAPGPARVGPGQAAALPESVRSGSPRARYGRGIVPTMLGRDPAILPTG